MKKNAQNFENIEERFFKYFNMYEFAQHISLFSKMFIWWKINLYNIYIFTLLIL